MTAALPQLEGGVFLTDGGIETTLIFRDGYDLPYFVAFDLLARDGGRASCSARASRCPTTGTSVR